MMPVLNIDPYGFKILCKGDYESECCSSIDYCNNCNLLCSILELLPYGKAWDVKVEKQKSNLNLCDAIDLCAPCEPQALRRYIMAMVKGHERTLRRAHNAMLELNPLTSKNKAHWIDKFGLRAIFSPSILDECGEEECSDVCDGCLSDDALKPTLEQQGVLDFALLKAKFISEHPDFSASLFDINRALHPIGYSVSISNKKVKDDCKKDGYVYDLPQCEEDGSGYIYDENSQSECKENLDEREFVEFCVDQGSVYGDCPPCKQEILRLKLTPIANSLPIPQDKSCGAVSNCSNQDGCLNLCGTIGNVRMVNIMQPFKLICGEKIMGDYRLTQSLAVNFLKRIWPLSQPYKIVEVL